MDQVRLRSARAPYTRGGVRFASNREEIILPRAELSDDALRALEGDPQITVTHEEVAAPAPAPETEPELQPEREPVTAPVADPDPAAPPAPPEAAPPPPPQGESASARKRREAREKATG